jgi:hypothetical protein
MVFIMAFTTVPAVVGTTFVFCASVRPTRESEAAIAADQFAFQEIEESRLFLNARHFLNPLPEVGWHDSQLG